MSSGGAIRLFLEIVWVVVQRRSQNRLFIQEIFSEWRWQQLTTLFWKNAQKLFEWFRRLPLFNFRKFIAQTGKIIQVEKDITNQRSTVVRIEPLPTGQIDKIIFIDKLKSMKIVGEDFVKLFCLLCGVYFEILTIIEISCLNLVVFVVGFQLENEFVLFHCFLLGHFVE